MKFQISHSSHKKQPDREWEKLNIFLSEDFALDILPSHSIPAATAAVQLSSSSKSRQFHPKQSAYLIQHCYYHLTELHSIPFSTDRNISLNSYTYYAGWYLQQQQINIQVVSIPEKTPTHIISAVSVSTDTQNTL